LPRRSRILLALLVGALGLAHAQSNPVAERVTELIRRFRELETRPLAPRKEDQVAILRELAHIDFHIATRFVIRVAEDPNYLGLREELLKILADVERDDTNINTLMRDHMTPDDPYRAIARDYLLKRAIRGNKEDWLVSLYSMGATTEDRFLALEALGRIGATSTLDIAWKLAEDGDWQPRADSIVKCGTIVQAVHDHEGPRAARLLLLIAKDKRFTAADRTVLREATHLWKQSDLRRYIDFRELVAGDALQRIDTALFLGRAGIEEARAPLLHLARNEIEPADLRAAAADSLGRLSIARGALSLQLRALLHDREPLVQLGAIEGLSRLGVRQAAVALSELANGGPLDNPARQALSRMTGLPPETDWIDWVNSPRCDLPEGT